MMMDMDPVIELSGEISEVEDLTSASAIMQSSESSMSLYEEEDGGGESGGSLEVTQAGAAGASVAPLPSWLAKAHANAGTSASKKTKRRYYAVAITLAMVVAGCGYLATSGELDPESEAAKGLDEQSAFAKPSVPFTLGSSSGSGSGRSSAAGAPASDAIDASLVLNSSAVLQSGGMFRIQLASAERCLDVADTATSNDRSSATPATTTRTLVFATCDAQRATQAFVYDPFNYFIMSVAHASWCVASSGDSSSGNSSTPLLQLQSCGSQPWRQFFEFDRQNATFQNTHLGLCVTAHNSSASTSARSAASTLASCTLAKQQRMALASVIDPTIWTPRRAILQHSDEFLLRSVGKLNLCMESSESRAGFSVQVARCSANSGGQRFTYNASMHWIQSAARPELCLDDNSAWLTANEANNARVTLTHCDPLSYNQKFVYDEHARMVRSPGKPRLCLDDGGGYDPGASAFRVAQCDVAAGNQQFELILRSAMYSVSPAMLLATASPPRTFVVESIYKAMCVDVLFRMQPCDHARGAPDQSFQYDSVRQAIQSAVIGAGTPALFCWTHTLVPSNASSFGVAHLTLEPCGDARSLRQRFVYNETANALESSAGLCLDDGGGWFAGETPLALRPCDTRSMRQRFLLRSTL